VGGRAMQQLPRRHPRIVHEPVIPVDLTAVGGML
jgi:hypothetical protein